MRLPIVRSGSVYHRHVGWTVGRARFWADGGKTLRNGCLNLFSWSFSMWKWSPVFTVRDLALLSSRWSRPASERAPSPQSPVLSLLSLLSSPIPSTSFFPLHLISHSNPISSASFPFSFHLLLPPTLSITVSYFFPLTHLSPLSLVSPLCSACLLFLPPSLHAFGSRLSSSLILCSRVSKKRLWGEARSLWEGDAGSPSPPDPWSLCSVHLPLET